MNPTRTRELLLLGLSLAVCTSAAAQAAKNLNLNFSTSRPKGGCVIGFQGANAPGTDRPMKLEFSVRVRDGNFGAAIKVNGWPRAREQDPGRNVPLTLAFDHGEQTTSRSGGYDSGFNDKLWAGWGPGEGSDAARAMLEGASRVRVRADDLDFGEFDLQLNGLAYRWLEDCVAKQKAGEH